MQNVTSNAVIERAVRVADLVMNDARQAISCHAAFTAANEEVRAACPSGGPVIFANVETFNVALFSMLTHLSLILARLFDPGPPGAKLQKTDIASIPILMRYLALDEVANSLRLKARSWTHARPMRASGIAFPIQDEELLRDSAR